MPGQEDLQGIKVSAYEAFFNDQFLGVTLLDTLNAQINGEYVSAEVDQFSGIAAEFQTGLPAVVNMTLLNTSPAFLAPILLRGQVDYENVNGVGTMYGGTQLRQMLDESISAPLILHPNGVPREDRANDLAFWLAAAKIENLEIFGGRTRVQDFPISFTVYPDRNREPGKQYWAFGDWAVSNVTPLAVYITANRQAVQPLKGVPAMTLEAGQSERMNVNRVNGTVPASNDADVDGAFAAGDTAIAFDGLTQARLFRVGDTVRFDGNGDYGYITALTYSTDFAGTMTVIRGQLDEPAQAIADNSGLSLIRDVAVIESQAGSDWASDAPAVATVGNVYAASNVDSRKGQIRHVSAGSANITATYNAVTSKNLVITCL